MAVVIRSNATHNNASKQWATVTGVEGLSHLTDLVPQTAKRLAVKSSVNITIRAHTDTRL